MYREGERDRDMYSMLCYHSNVIIIWLLLVTTTKLIMFTINIQLLLISIKQTIYA